MKKKEIIIGAGLAAIGATAASAYSASKNLLSFAIDRNPPEIFQRMMGSTRLDPDLAALSGLNKQMAENLENAPHKQVQIQSHDGLTLVGHWFAVERPERIILAMHGWRSTWAEDFTMIADFWAENNCSVLYVEQRAQGNSEGNYIGFGMLERYDCRSWLEWITRSFGKEMPVYLCGISMGASSVLMASGFAMPNQVKGIIADCGFTSAEAIWRHVTESNMHLSYSMCAPIVDAMCNKKIKMGAKGYSCQQALRDNKIPVLFIHGSDDKLVPVEMSYENYRACSAEKQLFIVPGAGHGLSYCVDKTGYEAVVKNFWEKNDRR